MKKITLILALVFVIGALNAQNSNLINAFNHLKKRNWEKAKGYIDLASEHEDTKDKATTWFYKGSIYLGIASSDEKEINALYPDALVKAKTYYDKALNIDKEVYNDMLPITNPTDGIKTIGVRWAIKGEDVYALKQYFKAYEYYTLAYKYNPEPMFLYGTVLSGLNYEQNRKDTKVDTVSLAKENKTNLIALTKLKKEEAKFDLFMGFKNLAIIYQNEKDTVKAVAIVKKAETVYPDSLKVLMLKCNILFWANKGEEATSSIEMIKAKAPLDPNTWILIGSLYEASNFAEAEKSYLKAIELGPNLFTPNYNLTALYFNKFGTLKSKASKMDLEDPNYTPTMDEAKTWMNKAMPFAEKCYAMEKLEDKDKKDIVYMLKNIYANSGMNEKAKEMDTIYKSLK